MAIIKPIAKLITFPILVVSVAGLLLLLGIAYLFCLLTLWILGSWVWKKQNKPSTFLGLVGNGEASFDSDIKDMLNSVKKNTMG